MAKSTVSRSASKPPKPRADFPLFAHDCGRWAKKVKRRFCYFGTWADDLRGERAEKLWHSQRADLEKGVRQPDLTHGRQPEHVASDDQKTIQWLCDLWLEAKELEMRAEEIRPRTFAELVRTGKIVKATFGGSRLVETLGPDDFLRLKSKLADTRGPVALGNEITRVRSLFKWGSDPDNNYLDKPVQFGSSFKKAKRSTLRKRRAMRGDDDQSRMFRADELRSILGAVADQTLRAMILLGINCAFGQTDCARLRIGQVDLKSGWIRAPRTKTGADRGSRLWPETIDALKAALAVRPEPRDAADANLIFITRQGKRFIRESDGLLSDGTVDQTRWAHRTDLIGLHFGKVLRSLGINGRRGFYNLRHTFTTVADQLGDRQAVRFAMGHVDGSMTANYVHEVPSEARMQAIADHVHAWLFGPETKPAPAGVAIPETTAAEQ